MEPIDPPKKKKELGIIKQFLLTVPVLGPTINSSDKMVEGNYLGAAADFGVGVLDLFTFGVANKYKAGSEVVIMGTEKALVTNAVKGSWIKTSESMSVAAAEYQTSVTGQAANNSYLVNGVKFDGILNGVLVDAKSGMGNFVNKTTGEFQGWFKGARSLVDQAKRQIGAAEGTKIQWFFENKKVMQATQKLFKENGIKGIELINK